MATFQYVALNPQGREVRGRVEGADPRSATQSLRARQLFVVRIGRATGATEPGGSSATPRSSWMHSLTMLRGPRMRDRIFFFQQMGLMLRTGLTLLQALDVAREQAMRPQWAATIERVRQTIQSGKSLSQAMAAERRNFAPFTIKLVETAEASGELDRILDQIAVFMERRAELQRKLITGLTYPAIVVLASVGVAVFLVVKIIPKFAEFFARRNVALPWSTQFLVDLSDFMQQYGLAVLGGWIALLVVVVVVYRSRAGRALADRLVLSVPVVGPLLSTGAMAQFAQTMSLLLGSGVTLLESLRISASVLGNRAMSDAIAQSAEQILRGQDLTRSLTQPVIPRLVTQVVAVGERTGSLSQVLDELHVFYDRQLQASIQRLASLIEPVMILVVGGMVGFVYFAFFQAIFQLATAGR